MKINGSLVFDASSASEIANLRVQKLAGASVPAHTAADTGRAIYVTSTGGSYTVDTLYIGSATAWVAIATGGNAAALQTEVDATQTSLGAMINSSGVFVPGQMTIASAVSTATTVTGMLQELAAAISGKDQLSELDDVTLTALATGQYLKYDGAIWANDTLQLNDVTDVTATAAQVNVLATIPAGLTGVELGYVDGVTSGIQGQLDLKQPLDAGLTSMAALTGPGFVTVDSDGNVVSARSLVAPAAGITITNVDGSGNPVFALANDLAALEGLGALQLGYIVRTADGAAATRAIAGTIGNIVVTNGSGVGSDTSLDLAVITQAGTGDFRKVTLDTFGRVVGNNAVVAADITALVDATYVNVSGDSMDSAANIIFAGGGTIKGIPAPTLDTDAANKAYVDALSAGLSWKAAVRAATTVNITLSAPQTVDGVALVAGNRVLVKNQTLPAENGIYVVAAGAWTRAVDMDTAAEFDGSAVFVQEGSTQEGQGFTETLTVTTVDTSPVAFSQFSGGQAFIGGSGIDIVGNTISVALGSGIFEGPTDAVGIDLYTPAVSALILTTDGTTRESSLSMSGKLHLLLDLTATGGLQQDAGGLRILANSITNAMILNDTMVINSDGGTGSLALGGTLEVRGTSVQGIVTSNVGSVFTITASDASTSAKGVASFASGDFDVTAGVVTVKALGIDNAQLVNSIVTIAGTTGSDAVALGETLTFSSAVSGLVSSTVATNGVALDVRLATDVLTGVASFAAADFTVAAGEVSVVAKGLDALTDVTITSAVAGDILVHNGAGQFVNKKAYFLYTSSASATSHTVTHNLGQQFCNVTVLDSTDEVVIPQSITMSTVNQLVVTFNTTIDCKVVVMGIA